MGLAWVGTKLYMFGGQTFFEPSQSQSRVPVLKNDMYIYAANTGWAELSAGGTVPPPMQVNSMTAVGSKIYVPAQEVMYVFDPDTLAWSDLSPSVVGTPAAFSSFKAAWVGSRFFAFDAGEQIPALRGTRTRSSQGSGCMCGRLVVLGEGGSTFGAVSGSAGGGGWSR